MHKTTFKTEINFTERHNSAAADRRNGIINIYRLLLTCFTSIIFSCHEGNKEIMYVINDSIGFKIENCDSQIPPPPLPHSMIKVNRLRNLFIDQLIVN